MKNQQKRITGYAVMDRKLSAYSNFIPDYDIHGLADAEVKLKTLHPDMWNYGAFIVTQVPKVIGFRLRIISFNYHSFWPKFNKYDGLEIFKMQIKFEREYHDFSDSIHFDPLGEWPKGTKVEEIMHFYKRTGAK